MPVTRTTPEPATNMIGLILHIPAAPAPWLFLETLNPGATICGSLCLLLNELFSEGESIALFTFFNHGYLLL